MAPLTPEEIQQRLDERRPEAGSATKGPLNAQQMMRLMDQRAGPEPGMQVDQARLAEGFVNNAPTEQHRAPLERAADKLPLAHLPGSIEEARSMWADRGHRFYSAPGGKTDEAAEEIAAGLAFETLTTMGLLDSQARLSSEITPDDVNELIGAYRMQVVAFGSPMSPKERQRTVSLAVKAWAGHTEQSYAAAIEEARANGDTERVEHLAQRAATAREIGARADEPRVASVWLHRYGQSLDRLRSAFPQDSTDAQLLELRSSQFGRAAAIEEEYHAARSEYSLSQESFLQRFERLIDEAQAQLGDAYAPDRAIRSAMSGAILRERARTLGVPSTRFDSLSLQSSALMMDGRLARKLLDASAMTKSKRELGFGTHEDIVPEAMQKVKDRLETSVPWALDRLSTLAVGPWTTMRSIVPDSPHASKAAAVADRAGQMLSSVASGAGGAFGELMEWHQDLQELVATGPLETLFGPAGNFRGAVKKAQATLATVAVTQRSQAALKRMEAAQARARALRAAGVPDDGFMIQQAEGERAAYHAALFLENGKTLGAMSLLAGLEDSGEILEQLGGTDFTPRLFRDLLRRAVASKSDQLIGDLKDDMKKSDEATAKSLRRLTASEVFDKPRALAEAVGNVAVNAYTRIKHDIAATAEMFAVDSQQATEIVGAFSLGGPTVGAITKASIGRLFKNAAFSAKAAQIIGNASASDRVVADQIIKELQRGAKNVGSARFENLYRASIANLEVVRDRLKLTADNITDPRSDPGRVAEISDSVLKAERYMRQLGHKRLDDVMRGVGFDEADMFAARRAGPRDVVQRFADRYMFRGFRVPTTVARRSKAVAAQLEEALDAGVEITDFNDLPLSFDVLAMGGSRARRLLNRASLRLFGPNGSRHINSVFRKLSALSRVDASYPRLLAEFSRDKAQALMAWRSLAGTKMSNIQDFIDTTIARARQEADDLSIVAAAFPDDEAAASALVAAESALSIREDFASVAGTRFWDDKFSLDDAPWFKEQVSFEEVYTWAQRNLGDLEIYDTLRNLKKRETWGEFQTKLTEVLQRGDDDAALNRTAQAWKRRIAREHLAAPGLRQRIDIDPQTGDAMTPQAAARRRLAVQRMEDGELADDVADFLPQEVSTDVVQKVRAAAQAERAAGFTVSGANAVKQMMVRSQDLSGLPPELMTHQTKQFQYAMMAGGMLAQKKAADLLREIRKLPLADQQRINIALLKFRDLGEVTDLAHLRHRFPELQRWFPENRDAAVWSAIENIEGLRKELIEWNADATGIGPRYRPIADWLQSAYVPQRYAFFEREALLKRADRKFEPSAKVEGRLPLTGADRSFLEPQREPGRWRAIVGKKDRVPFGKNFATKDQAQTWLKERFGARKVDRDGDDFVVTLGSGQTARILAPLDQGRAEALGLMDPTTATFARMRDVINSTMTARFLNILDRPGWTFTPEEYDTFIKTPEGAAASARNEFREMPDRPGLGRLAGKWAHKRTVGFIEDFGDRFSAVQALADTMRASMEGTHWALKTMNGLWGGAMAVGSTVKSLLIANLLQRDPLAIFNNYITDRLVFAATAVGQRFAYSLRGQRWASAAFDDLFEWMVKKRTVRKSRLDRAIDAGAIDDFGVIGEVDDRFRELLEDQFAGKIDDLDPEFRAMVKGLQTWEGDRFINAFRSALSLNENTGDKRIDLLRHQHDRALRRVKSEALSPNERNRLNQQIASMERVLARDYGTVPQKTGNAISATALWLQGKPTGRLRNKSQVSARFYNLVNNVNRLGAFYYATEELGWTPEMAVERINTFMQTFSRVPRLVRNLGRTPVANPVLSFPYEAARIFGNMAREELPTLAAWMLGVPAANMITNLSQGDNPFEVAAMMGMNSPMGVLEYATTLLIATGDGYSTVKHQALNPIGWLGYRSDPVYGGAVRADENSGLFGGAIDQGLRILAGNAFGNPLTKAAAAIASIRDPQNGRPVSTRFEALGLAAEEMLNVIVPRWFPYVGRMSREIRENLRKPPDQLVNRRQTLSQLLVRHTTGARIRGSLGSTAIPEGIRRTAIALAGGDPGDLPPDAPQPDIGEMDLLKALLIQAKRSPMSNPGVGEAIFERPEDEAFELARYRTFAERAGDAELAKKVGRESVAAEREFREQVASAEGKLPQRLTPQTVADLFKRASRTFDFEESFKDQPLSVQAAVIVTAAQFDMVSTKTTRRLLGLTLYSRNAQGGMERRSRSDIEGLIYAEGLLQEFVAANPDHAMTPAFQLWQSTVRRQRAEASWKHTKNALQTEMGREAVRAAREALDGE